MTTPDGYYEGVRSDVLALLKGEVGSEILEIGGGEFHTLLNLAGPGRTLSGVDIHHPKRPPDRFVLGSITDPAVAAQLPDGGFDLVIANDVLEHIVDTRAFIEIVAAKLCSGGRLLLSVPNARQVRLAFHILVRGTFPRTDAGLFDRTHVRWFCRRDVNSALETAGFRLIESRSVGRLVPRALGKTLLGELLGLQNIFLFSKP